MSFSRAPRVGYNRILHVVENLGLDTVEIGNSELHTHREMVANRGNKMIELQKKSYHK